MNRPPSTNGANGGSGRDGRGRFAVGNPGGPGNPKGAARARLWHEWMNCVNPGDVRRLYKIVTKKALAGDIEAARLILDLTLGRSRELPRVTGRRGQRAAAVRAAAREAIAAQPLAPDPPVSLPAAAPIPLPRMSRTAASVAPTLSPGRRWAGRATTVHSVDIRSL